MDKCPPEIHGRIFYFACLDDGTTGRTLPLVSRYINEVSSPYQWQSLRLIGIKDLKRFCEKSTKSSVLRRPVYHLFLGEPNGYDAEYYCNSDAAHTPHRNLCTYVSQVLQYVSPTLETFTFHSSAFCDTSAESLACIFQFHYPNLSELTVRSQCIPAKVVQAADTSQVPLRSPPNLRRLHFAFPCHGFSHDNFDSLRQLTNAIGPNVTHLRISMLDRWGSKRVAEVVHAELHELGKVHRVIDLSPITEDISPTVTAQEVGWARLLPESLELLVLQPSPTLNFYCSCCMELRGDSNVMRLFERLSETAEEDFFTFIPQELDSTRLLNRYPYAIHDTVYGMEEARDDWHRRIRDSAGCWERKVETEKPPLVVDGEGVEIGPSSRDPSQIRYRAKEKRRLFVSRSVRKFFGKLKRSARYYVLGPGLRRK